MIKNLEKLERLEWGLDKWQRTTVKQALLFHEKWKRENSICTPTSLNTEWSFSWMILCRVDICEWNGFFLSDTSRFGRWYRIKALFRNDVRWFADFYSADEAFNLRFQGHFFWADLTRLSQCFSLESFWSCESSFSAVSLVIPQNTPIMNFAQKLNFKLSSSAITLFAFSTFLHKKISITKIEFPSMQNAFTANVSPSWVELLIFWTNFEARNQQWMLNSINLDKRVKLMASQFRQAVWCIEWLVLVARRLPDLLWTERRKVLEVSLFQRSEFPYFVHLLIKSQNYELNNPRKLLAFHNKLLCFPITSPACLISNLIHTYVREANKTFGCWIGTFVLQMFR